VFNDVAVAARALLDAGKARRILIVDLDVHQGDGTARLFASEPAVFTLSLHCEANFPARKARSDLDIALPPGTEDGGYASALESALDRAGDFAPDFVFYNAGVDPHHQDRLGRLALSDAGLEARDAAVFAFARSRAQPIASVLGGGYGPVEDVARRHTIVHRVAARFC
jgi:acetoin utilization deacetylase AcuC-like enzyme